MNSNKFSFCADVRVYLTHTQTLKWEFHFVISAVKAPIHLCAYALMLCNTTFRNANSLNYLFRIQ